MCEKIFLFSGRGKIIVGCARRAVAKSFIKVAHINLLLLLKAYLGLSKSDSDKSKLLKFITNCPLETFYRR